MHLIDLRCLMLQSAAVNQSVGPLKDRVVAERSLAKDGNVFWNEFLEPAEGAVAPGGSECRRWIEREANPFAGDPGAVDSESPDVERHVGEIVVVGRDERVHSGRCIHSSCDSPARLRTNHHLCRPVERATHRIEKNVGAVEESKVGRCPRNCAIDGVRQVFEADRDCSRATRFNLPRLKIEFPPFEQRTVLLRRKRGYAPTEPEQDIVAGRPRRQREDHWRGSTHVERHRHTQLTLADCVRVSCDLVTDVRDRRRRSWLLSRSVAGEDESDDKSAKHPASTMRSAFRQNFGRVWLYHTLRDFTAKKNYQPAAGSSKPAAS